VNAKSGLARVAAGLALLAVLYAIKVPAPDPRMAAEKAGSHRVALFVNGTLGDKSFFDSAARGVRGAGTRHGLRTKIIEAGTDPTRWASSLTDVVVSGAFDIVVVGGYAMVAHVEKLAAVYPRQRFIVFDAAVSPQRCACPNVYSVTFRQNEAAFVAGYLAARSVASDGAASRQPPTLGVVGAMQIPVIEDFVVGFKAGATQAAPSTKVIVQYVNSFSDPATAKEIAKALYGRGAEVVFQVAGGSGHGVLEAAGEAGRAVIGVDADQYELFRSSHPERARAILTSVLKRVDTALELSLAQVQQGQLPFGTAQSLGLAEGAVALAMGSERMRALPPALREELAKVQRQVISGAVQVPSALVSSPSPGGR
jgi:basic membrane protein A and related proteins